MKHAVTYSVFLLCCLAGICSCHKNYTCTCRETIIGHLPATVSASFNQEKKLMRNEHATTCKKESV